MTAYDYGFRIYNPAIGKFLSVDPLTKEYPMLTSYQFAGNEPISSVDLDGLERLLKGKDGTWYVEPEIISNDATSYFHNPAVVKIDPPKPEIKLPQSQTFIRAYNSVLSFKERQTNLRRIEAQENYEEFIETGQKLYPLDFGGTSNNPFGFARTFGEALKQAPLVLIPEIGIAKFQQLRHLAKFSKGGTNLTTTKRLAQFANSPNFGGPKGLFLAPSAEVDALLARGATRAEIEIALGLKEGTLNGGKLVRIDVTNPSKFNLRLPTEGNSKFIQGGKTSGGVSEAIVDPIKKGTENVTKTILKDL